MDVVVVKQNIFDIIIVTTRLSPLIKNAKETHYRLDKTLVQNLSDFKSIYMMI